MDRLWPRKDALLVRGHVVQIGDPVLRLKALPVRPEDVESQFVKDVVDALRRVLRKYDAIGLSAQQVSMRGL